MVAQAWIRPVGRALRVFLLCLDGASDEALNVLLQGARRAARPPVRFILTASALPLKTIVSRCQVLTLAPPEQAPEARLEPGAGRGGHRGAGGPGRAPGRAGDIMARWGAEHTAVLRAWAAERAADRWAEFGEDFVTGVTVRQAMTILAVLRAYDGARTAPHVALVKAFTA